MWIEKYLASGHHHIDGVHFADQKLELGHFVVDIRFTGGKTLQKNGGRTKEGALPNDHVVAIDDKSLHLVRQHSLHHIAIERGGHTVEHARQIGVLFDRDI